MAIYEIGKKSDMPFLRWAGSKKQHISVLSSFWSPTFGRYVEPFVGSASLFFALSPREAILGDLNQELIEMYRTVRRHYKEVHELMSSWSKGRNTYLRVRGLSPRSLIAPARAARFIYLNRFCFNGLYRTNKSGVFNVPYGGDRAGQLPSLRHLEACAKVLRHSKLVASDFRDTLSMVESRDFVYLDPPYAVGNRRVFKEYGAQAFDVKDLQDLSSELHRLNRLGAAFVVSYADCKEARDLFKKWNVRRLRTRRCVAGFHAARRKQYELIATNF